MIIMHGGHVFSSNMCCDRTEGDYVPFFKFLVVVVVGRTQDSNADMAARFDSEGKRRLDK